MRTYQISVTRPDGTRATHHGLYSSSCAAIVATLDHFPHALRISAKRITP